MNSTDPRRLLLLIAGTDFAPSPQSSHLPRIKLTGPVDDLQDIIREAKGEPPVEGALSDEELWAVSKVIGDVVNEMADRIMERGFTEKRFNLVRWLTYVAMVARHPECHAAEEGEGRMTQDDIRYVRDRFGGYEVKLGDALIGQIDRSLNRSSRKWWAYDVEGVLARGETPSGYHTSRRLAGLALKRAWERN